MARTRAEALETLICDMLRGPHVREMSEEQVKRYAYLSGVALHNLPAHLEQGRPLLETQLLDINMLDPDAREGEWGPWGEMLCESFQQEPPAWPDNAPESFFQRPDTRQKTWPQPS